MNGENKLNLDIRIFKSVLVGVIIFFLLWIVIYFFINSLIVSSQTLERTLDKLYLIKNRYIKAQDNFLSLSKEIKKRINVPPIDEPINILPKLCDIFSEIGVQQLQEVRADTFGLKRELELLSRINKNKNYLVVITYSKIEYAIIQKRNLLSQDNRLLRENLDYIKIIPSGNKFLVSIYENEVVNGEMRNYLKTWNNEICPNQTNDIAYIHK